MPAIAWDRLTFSRGIAATPSASAGGENLKISRTDRPHHKKTTPKAGKPTGSSHNHKKSSNNNMSNTATTQLVNIPLTEMQEMAKIGVESNFFGIKKPMEALALMLIAQSEGKHPATVFSQYHVIQGRPALKSDAMLARFQQAGGKVEWHDHTNEKVSATFIHPQGGALTVDWDMPRAKEAGLTGKDNYKKFPRQMLRARVISEGVRAVYPGVLQGMYTPEEVGEFDAPRTAPRSVKVELATGWIEEPKCVEAVVEPVAVPATIEAEVSFDTAPNWSDELEKRIFEHEKQVNAFLIAKGQISEGQTFRDISDEGYRSRVMSNTPRFIEAVLKEVA